MKGESAAMADTVKKLTVTAASLGLPYGHIEETLAKDPISKRGGKPLLKKLLKMNS